MGQNNSKLVKKESEKHTEKENDQKTCQLKDIAWEDLSSSPKRAGSRKKRFARLRKWFGGNKKGNDVTVIPSTAPMMNRHREFLSIDQDDMDDEQLSRTFYFRQPRKLTFRRVMASCFPWMQTERDLEGYEFKEQTCDPHDTPSTSYICTANLKSTNSSTLEAHLSALFCSERRNTPNENIECPPSSIIGRCDDNSSWDVSSSEIAISMDDSFSDDNTMSISSEFSLEIEVEIPCNTKNNHGDASILEDKKNLKFDDEIQIEVSNLLSDVIEKICNSAVEEVKTQGCETDAEITIEVSELMSEIVGKIVEMV